MKKENIIFKGQFLSQLDYEYEFHNCLEVPVNYEPLDSTNDLCD